MATTSFNDTLLPTPPVRDAETREGAAPTIVGLTDPGGPAAEQYRVLRARLERIAEDGHRALLFSSAGPREGRTTTAVNVAVALARGGGRRVALVDADLRRPGVHQLLGLQVRQGLCDVVSGQAQLGDCLWRLGDDALQVLPAGRVPPGRSTVLFEPRLASLFEELKLHFDHVIVDAPPILPYADVGVLCRRLDGLVLVVRAGQASRERVQAALQTLDRIPVHGIVLNDLAAPSRTEGAHRGARASAPPLLPERR